MKFVNSLVPLHRVSVVVMKVTLAAGETRHRSLVVRATAVRFHQRAVQNRVVVRRWTRMRHARPTATRESVPERTALRVSAGPRFARVSAIADIHSAQCLGENSNLCNVITLLMTINTICRGQTIAGTWTNCCRATWPEERLTRTTCEERKIGNVEFWRLM